MNPLFKVARALSLAPPSPFHPSALSIPVGVSASPAFHIPLWPPLRPPHQSRSTRGRPFHPSLSQQSPSPCPLSAEYPWQVAILKKEEFDNVYLCGGSLIDGSHIVTAAHCVDDFKPNELRWVLT